MLIPRRMHFSEFFYYAMTTRLESLFSARGKYFSQSDLRAWKTTLASPPHMIWDIFKYIFRISFHFICLKRVTLQQSLVFKGPLLMIKNNTESFAYHLYTIMSLPRQMDFQDHTIMSLPRQSRSWLCLAGGQFWWTIFQRGSDNIAYLRFEGHSFVMQCL